VNESDAAYVVFVPLAAFLFAVVGRHPLAGLAAAFAVVSGGFAGNITPGQSDVTLFAFAQRWDRNVGVGSLLALMLPHAQCFMAAGITMTVAWVALDWPLGPGAQVRYSLTGDPM
jgi:aminobenzoyl-glutamate transport protein